MAFRISLYKTQGQKNSTSRIIDSGVTVNGVFKDDDNQSYLDPVVRFQTTDTFSIGSRNYAYIEPFNRYYWIKDVKVIRTNLYELHLHEDVIYSHRQAIRTNTAEIFVQESSSKELANPNINPGLIAPSSDGYITVYPCSGKLREQGGYVLVIPGS